MSQGFRPKCPICDRRIADLTLKSLPFCSDRCRLIDLGRWLTEEHSLPCETQEDESTPADLGSSDRPPVRLPPGWHDA